MVYFGEIRSEFKEAPGLLREKWIERKCGNPENPAGYILEVIDASANGRGHTRLAGGVESKPGGQVYPGRTQPH